MIIASGAVAVSQIKECKAASATKAVPVDTINDSYEHPDTSGDAGMLDASANLDDLAEQATAEAPDEVPADDVEGVGRHTAIGQRSGSGIWKYQEQVHAFYMSKHVELTVAGLIVFNFLVQCFQAQIDPYRDRHKLLWDVLGNFFNVVFLIELCLNMYGSWCRAFWRKGWNRFDFLVVSIGLADLCQIPLPGPLKLVRLLRAFRVFRLFGRVESLKKTVDSIFHALPGVMSAFAIVLLVLAIYSVIAVDVFRDLYSDCKDFPHDEVAITPRGKCFGQDYYGNFLKSMYSLFQILTGESWSEAAVRPVISYYSSFLEIFGVSFFFLSFILINGVVIINVVVAFLMDGMSGGGEEQADSADVQPPDMVQIKTKDPAELVALRSDLVALRKKLDHVMCNTQEQMLQLLRHWPDLLQSYKEEKHAEERRLAHLKKLGHHRTNSRTALLDVPDKTGMCAPIWKYQKVARVFYHSQPIEIGVACLIAGNFCLQCINAQIDPNSDRHKMFWDVTDNFFNIVFAMELVLNMYGSWCRPFWASPWNRFDFVVVSIGVLMMCDAPLPGPMDLIRLLRAFRVFRLFGKVESLNKTVMMIQRALPGVMSAFLVAVITLCIYAVLSVDFFKDLYEGCYDKYSDDPVSTTKRKMCFGEDYYGNFLKSLYTLFQILTGESWSEAAVRPVLQYYERDYIYVAGVSFFFISFLLLNSVVILNVVVAFLIDGMGDPFAAEDDQEDAGPLSVKCELQTVQSELESFMADIRENFEEIFKGVTSRKNVGRV